MKWLLHRWLMLRLPTSNAVLTLANGKRIIIDSAQNGVMARQGQVRLVKSEDGQIAYEVKGTGAKRSSFV